MSALVCSVKGCEWRHHARGYCQPHYRRWMRTGDVRAHVLLGERPESVLPAPEPMLDASRLSVLGTKARLARAWCSRYGVTMDAGERAADRLAAASEIRVDSADRWCVALGLHLALVYPELYETEAA